ncbi:MAG TPA: (2Fe-2S) ferredoxin domain-containing protein [Nocardioides sp.]|uniref:(2Fe-2S) ferredoxin domain-containing protein n=1 Tax=Nocardioides sp. TaxID=35761 RepID=UPI002E30BEB2|nr:(2Fe-2S) ferredoxin domain-containing protein [Nocardioides sp.]HEX3931101.1 (2Fe-2S) ferredoxin domain-containing protein [Nocardioides sp.]
MAERPDHVVLVGMSLADALDDGLREAARAHDATVAFVQQADPSLSAELTRLADLGSGRILVVGVSLGPLAPAHSWLRRVAAYWWRERAGHRPELDVATRVASSVDQVTEVMATARSITGAEPGLTSAAWESVTAHRHQVNLCRGPRCTAQGSPETLRALVLAILEQRLGDDDVLLVHTGCQFPCNQSPVLSVQPDDVWYGHVHPEAARRIVAEHLVGGTPVESHRLPRNRPAIG